MNQKPTLMLLAALVLGRVVPALGFTAPHTNMPADVIDNSDPYQANDIVTGFGNVYLVPQRAGRNSLICADHDWAGMTGGITIK